MLTLPLTITLTFHYFSYEVSAIVLDLLSFICMITNNCFIMQQDNFRKQNKKSLFVPNTSLYFTSETLRALNTDHKFL